MEAPGLALEWDFPLCKAGSVSGDSAEMKGGLVIDGEDAADNGKRSEDRPNAARAFGGSCTGKTIFRGRF